MSVALGPTYSIEELAELRSRMLQLHIGGTCQLLSSKYDPSVLKGTGHVVVTSLRMRPTGFVPVWSSVMLSDGQVIKLTSAQTRRLVPL
jgi:hypothetical protein